jgi:asparagine synthase (glutamine-hydrolysing)
MDSTSVALLARDRLLAGSGEPPLHTFSLIYERLRGLARETPYIDCALRRGDGLVAHRVVGDDLLDFDSFTRPPVHEEPWPGLPCLAPECALLDEAERAGVSTLLTGSGGDALFDVPPFFLADLVRRGRLWAAWRESCARAGAWNCPAWRVFFPFGVAPLLPARLRHGLGQLWRRGRADWKRLNRSSVPPWILPAFARRHALWDRALARHRRTYAGCRPMTLSVMIAALAGQEGDLSRRYLAGPRGIHLTHPLLDPRVAALGLGVQLRFRPDPGRRKQVLTEAMRRVVPQEIRERRVKSHFGEVCYLGLARNLPALEALVSRAPADDLGLLDRKVLCECLQQAALGVTTDFGAEALDRLYPTLALLAWLESREEWLRAADPPDEVLPGSEAGERLSVAGALR